MSVIAVPYNIHSYTTALAEGLSYGDKVHIVTIGGHKSDDLFFVKFYQKERGIEVSHSLRTVMPIIIQWGEIIELWSLEEKLNVYHSDVPEVADVLKNLKISVQKCVEADNGLGVLYLLDQISEVKKAEPFLKEARKIIATIRFQ